MLTSAPNQSLVDLSVDINPGCISNQTRPHPDMNGAAVSAVPGSVVTPIFANPNVKDSRWLTLEVCREYTRNKCTRSDQECKFAHPPPHVEVQNGRVTCCFDSIKGKCQRKDPPCKYLHPPQHLKEQLLQNGRNNLILRNLQWQALAGGLQPFVPTAVPTVPSNANGKPGGATTAGFHNTILPAPYPTVLSAPAGTYMVQNSPSAYHPFMNTPGMMQGMDNTGVSIPVSAASATQQIHPGLVTAGPNPSSMTQKVARADRLESSTAVSGSSGSISSTWNGHPAHGSPSESIVTSASHYNQHHPVYFQSMNHFPGMVPIVKRTAIDGKSGVPMYPSTGTTATYQQALAAMQLQQQYVPVTMSMIPNTHAAATAAAGALVTNATSVNYFDEGNQLLDTLPVCRDFKAGQCKRPQCKYVHLVEDYVEVLEGKVTVCRDAVKAKCSRPLCKYYHIPILPQLLL